MKLHWWTLIIGYLVGSFFGLARILGLFQGMGSAKSAPAAATS